MERETNNKRRQHHKIIKSTHHVLSCFANNIFHN